MAGYRFTILGCGSSGSVPRIGADVEDDAAGKPQEPAAALFGACGAHGQRWHDSRADRYFTGFSRADPVDARPPSTACSTPTIAPTTHGADSLAWSPTP